VLDTMPSSLSVSADALRSEEDERGSDERLKLQFKAVSKLDTEEREAIETVINGVHAGFEPGSRARVHIEHGRLTITAE
jgi:hypothetical protein